jgi:hypothetical protein
VQLKRILGILPKVLIYGGALAGTLQSKQLSPVSTQHRRSENPTMLLLFMLPKLWSFKLGYQKTEMNPGHPAKSPHIWWRISWHTPKQAVESCLNSASPIGKSNNAAAFYATTIVEF